jgi:hypothetical protein
MSGNGGRLSCAVGEEDLASQANRPNKSLERTREG